MGLGPQFEIHSETGSPVLPLPVAPDDSQAIG